MFSIALEDLLSKLHLTSGNTRQCTWKCPSNGTTQLLPTSAVSTLPPGQSPCQRKTNGPSPHHTQSTLKALSPVINRFPIGRKSASLCSSMRLTAIHLGLWFTLLELHRRHSTSLSSKRGQQEQATPSRGTLSTTKQRTLIGNCTKHSSMSRTQFARDPQLA
jgi:hypothetical protein